MLTYKDLGIQKFIFDRICQIDEEIVDVDPEYKQLGEYATFILPNFLLSYMLFELIGGC
jgi:hypothetical protein